MASELNSFIEETEFYRGQIVYRWKRPQINGATTRIFLKSNGEFNPYSAYHEFYEHQAELVNKLNEGQNVLFLSPFNTGRSTIALLYALDVVFNRHKSVLIISPNSFEKELEIKLLNRILTESKLDWLVDIHDIKKEIDKEEYAGLFPSIYVIEARDLHWFLLPNHSRYFSLFVSLGLVIFDDFEKFSGNLASNLHYISKRFELIYSAYNNDKEAFQYLVLSKPFHESKRTTERIFERKFEILYRDDKAILPSSVFYWVPAFDKVDVTPSADGTLTRKTQRDSFIDDAYILAIESLKRGRKTVVYYSNIPLSKDDIKIREVHLKWNSRFGQYELDPKNDFFIGYDWSDLTFQLTEKGISWENIDTIIIALFSGSMLELRDNILHTGNMNSEIFITMPQTPSFQYEINHPRLEIIQKTSDIAKGETMSIFAYSEGEGVKEKHRQISANEINDLNDDISQERFSYFWKTGSLKEDISTINIIAQNSKEIKGYDIYSTEQENYFILIDVDDNVIGTINAYELPDSYFKGAVVCSQNMRYQVDRIDLDKKEIKLLPLGKFLLPISKREMEKISETTKNNNTFFSLNFNVKKLTVKAKFNHYKASTGTDTTPAAFHDSGENNLHIDYLELTGIELTTPNISNDAFANIFNISLNTIISLYNLVPHYFFYGNNSFFYNLGSEDLTYIINDVNIKNVLERALTLLIDCPCQQGCAGCTENFKIDTINYSKKDLIDYLGALLKKDNINTIQRWKYNEIGAREYLREDMAKFRQVRDKVFDILKYKADMIIKNPCEEKFLSDDDRKRFGPVGGLCDGKNVYINTGYSEAIFTEICAHEYTHNWQYEGNLNGIFRIFNSNKVDDESNIWFEGKLFSEGQANFFAAKVSDYFGLRNMVYQNEFSSYGEYREGLILMNYLEKKYGLLNLNHIMREGKFRNGTPITIKDVYDWYDESGIKVLVRGEGDRLFNENDMRCITHDFLEKTLDFHRITYHISHRVFSQRPTLSEQIQEAELTEEAAYQKIWEILKEHFNITPKKDYDYLPCKDCAYKTKETLYGLCMMFGSISVQDKINQQLTSLSEKWPKN